MTYQEFLKELTAYLRRQLPDGTRMHLSQVLKTNGLRLDCITFSAPGLTVSPAVYPEDYFSRLSTCSLASLADEILSLYRDISRHSPDTSLFTNPSRLRPYVVFRLIQQKQNRELLEDLPHIPFLDLAIVFYLLLPCGDHAMTGSALIRHEHLRSWHMTVQDLADLARENTPRLLKQELLPMEEMLRQLLTPEAAEALFTDDRKERCPLYVLTNRLQLYGAGCMLYDGVLETFATARGCDLYVLPSSVHEVLLMPVSEKFSKEELDEMILQVNREHVSREDILSDHVYRYSLKDRKLIC